MDRRITGRDPATASESGSRASRRGDDRSRDSKRAGPAGVLQRAVGNQAVQDIHRSDDLQATLAVSQPDDASEREADRVAEAVVSRADTDGGARPDDSPSPWRGSPERPSGIQRLCGRCRKRYRQGKDLNCPDCEAALDGDRPAAEPAIQRQTGAESRRSREGTGDGEATAGIASLRAGGRPLPTGLRAELEPRFGHDFGDVTVHTGPRADALARSIHARAFTVGTDVVFRAGEYDPGSERGKRLLAHELTHVVQQRRGSGSRVQPQYVGGRSPGTEGPESAATGDLPSDYSGSYRGYVAGGGSGQLTSSAGSGTQSRYPGCSESEDSDVDDAHDRGLEMIDTALEKLSRYDGTDPPEVTNALQTHFKTSGSAFAEWVEFNLRYLRGMAPMASYQCSGSGRCSGGTLAWAAWCVPLFDIRVCKPEFFNRSNEERATTMIHEWVHKYGCNFDFGYSHEPDYSEQWTATALLNADPFAVFVRDVQ